MSAAPDRRLQVGGTLDPERDIYIVRPEDEAIFQALARGEYVAILDPRQQGKSSAMRYAARRLLAAGVAVADVDLAGTLGTTGVTRDQWYIGLLRHIARQLDVAVDAAAFWRERAHATPSQRLQEFFGDLVIPAIARPIVVFLDEIDSTMELEPPGAADDLFICLRAMYNQRSREPAWRRLTFCLIGVLRPHELIRRRRVTPYNVGQTIELRDFQLDRDDLEPLVALLERGAHGPDIAAAAPVDGRALLEEILLHTHGHPFLTASLCQRCVAESCTTRADVARVIQAEFADPGHAREHAHFASVARIFDQRAGIGALALYKRVLAGARVPSRVGPDQALLELAGLIKRDTGGNLRVRNPIYARVFDRAWLRHTEPGKTARYLAWAMIFVVLNALSVAAWIAYRHYYL